MNEVYHQEVKAIFKKIFATQKQNVIDACQLGYDSVLKGKKFYVLGTGHSHVVPEELYARLKGTDFFTPIIPPEFMLHQFPGKSSAIERLAPYADIVLGMYPIEEGDTMMLVSNSGRNGLLVELALRTKEKKANLITMVNHEQAKVIPSRHSNGKNMIHYADTIIDNCGPFGDAGHDLGDGLMTGSTSNMTTTMLAQMMNAIMINLSSNGKESNMEVLNRFEEYFFNSFNQTVMQKENLHQAALLINETIANERKFFVYGGGHSHIVTEEVYSRAGGVPFITPILEDEIMVHMSADKSNLMETSVEYASILMQKYGLKSNDLLVIVSNSGKGRLTVEFAKLAKEANVKIVALTNQRQAQTTKSMHPSGKLLVDFADIIIDNCAPVNDAAFMIEDRVCCPLSTSLACYLAQSLIVDLCHIMIDAGVTPPIALSGNLDPQTEKEKQTKAASIAARSKYKDRYLYQGPKPR